MRSPKLDENYLDRADRLVNIKKWGGLFAFPFIRKYALTDLLVKNITDRDANEICTFPNEPSRYLVKASCL